jgi:hypothetical protein
MMHSERLRFHIIYALFCMLTALSIQYPAFAKVNDNKTVLDIAPSAEFPRNSEGAFVTLKNGAIFYAYSQFYGGTADHSKGRIVAIESRDGGLTWSAMPRTVVENIGKENVMSVSLLRLASGEIALFYLVKNSFHDLKPWVAFSSDEAATWSGHTRMVDAYGYFVMNNDRVIQLKSGRLVAPLAFHRPVLRKNELEADRRGIALWYLSDDNGRSWRESDYWWALPEPDTRAGMQEPGVVDLADGSIFSWARTSVGVQYGFRSTDGGKTFSSPERTPLVSPTSPASIKRIPGSPDLLAVYNDHSGRFPFKENRRSPLVAAISHDGGRTWPIARVIEDDPDGHFCYTAIHFVGKYALLAYCAGSMTDKSRYGLNPHRIRRVSLDWLYGK